jgi:hypothetical protein
MLISDRERKVAAIFGSLVLWAALTWLDLALGLKVRIGPAWAIPVLLSAWYLGRGWSVLSAVISTALWHGLQMVELSGYSITFYQYWDLLSGLITFSTIALAASWATDLYNREFKLNSELRQAIDKIRVLEEMLPICAWCRKVRDEQGQWDPIETYISTHSNTTWTHGICPECIGNFKMLDPDGL